MCRLWPDNFSTSGDIFLTTLSSNSSASIFSFLQSKGSHGDTWNSKKGKRILFDSVYCLLFPPIKILYKASELTNCPSLISNSPRASTTWARERKEKELSLRWKKWAAKNSQDSAHFCSEGMLRVFKNAKKQIWIETRIQNGKKTWVLWLLKRSSCCLRALEILEIFISCHCHFLGPLSLIVVLKE